MTAQGTLARRGGASTLTPTDFQVVMISPDGYTHSAALSEIVETVVFGLHALGVNATFAINRLVAPGPPAVLFGAHLLTDEEAPKLPDETIIYNLEQIGGTSSWCTPAYLGLLKRCRVWDYSVRNIRALAKLGVPQRAVHVPVGYMPQLTRIPQAPVQDVDVLFYGSVNERRAAVINSLQRKGLNAQAVFGVYGRDRDTIISRSKVVLNLHYYDTSIFELVRVSYLLANRKAVVAECHPGTEVDDGIATAVRLTPYEQLVDACVELVADSDQRRALEKRALAWMSRRDEPIFLARALGLDLPGSTSTGGVP